MVTVIAHAPRRLELALTLVAHSGPVVVRRLPMLPRRLELALLTQTRAASKRRTWLSGRSTLTAYHR